MNGNPPHPQPPLMLFKITTEEGELQVKSPGFQPMPDGSLIFGDQLGTVQLIVNARYWKKVERSAIQPSLGGIANG